MPTISERAIAASRPPLIDPHPAAMARQHSGTRSRCSPRTAPGGRNHALNRAAFALFQLVAGGELDRDEVIEHLIDACHRNGLVKDDGLPSVVATIRSGESAGMQHPRSRGAA